MRIRDLEWRDFENLAGNYYSFISELSTNPSLGLLVPTEKPPMADEVQWFATLFSNVLKGDCVASVAEEDGRAVGMAEVSGSRSHRGKDHVGHLGIAIVGGHRGKGIGTALMEDVLRKCRGRFEIVVLTVFSNNERAKRLYQRFGFMTTGKIPRCIRRNGVYYDEEEMTLEVEDQVGEKTANVKRSVMEG